MSMMRWRNGRYKKDSNGASRGEKLHLKSTLDGLEANNHRRKISIFEEIAIDFYSKLYTERKKMEKLIRVIRS